MQLERFSVGASGCADVFGLDKCALATDKKKINRVGEANAIHHQSICECQTITNYAGECSSEDSSPKHENLSSFTHPHVFQTHVTFCPLWSTEGSV